MREVMFGGFCCNDLFSCVKTLITYNKETLKIFFLLHSASHDNNTDFVQNTSQPDHVELRKHYVCYIQIGISMDETITENDLDDLFWIFSTGVTAVSIPYVHYLFNVVAKMYL